MRATKYAYPYDGRLGDAPPDTSAGLTGVAEWPRADGTGRREYAPTEEEPREDDAM